MTNRDDIAAVAAGLTASMCQVLADFEPGVWYGPTLPTRRAAASKGHMVRTGLVEHDGATPHSNYRLTPLGLAVKEHLERGA